MNGLQHVENIPIPSAVEMAKWVEQNDARNRAIKAKAEDAFFKTAALRLQNLLDHHTKHGTSQVINWKLREFLHDSVPLFYIEWSRGDLITSAIEAIVEKLRAAGYGVKTFDAGGCGPVSYNNTDFILITWDSGFDTDAMEMKP
jgi:hypothetical protein